VLSRPTLERRSRLFSPVHSTVQDYTLIERVKAAAMHTWRQRVLLALLNGYIFVYYGEFVFGATPDREGMHALDLLLTWAVYSLGAYLFLCLVACFRARRWEAVFLAGACFGWWIEGIIVQTTYGSAATPFPFSISFTGLAWHALLDVLIGWYWVRRLLAQNNVAKTLGAAAAIGAFYGVWAIFWWTEPPAPMQALLEGGQTGLLFWRFFGFALLSTALLVVAYWLAHRITPADFVPTHMELGLLGGLTLLYFVAVTIPAAPRALWVLPPLLGLTLWALARNRKHEDRADAIVAWRAPVQIANYLGLFMIPLVAALIYLGALALNLRLYTNLPIFVLSTLAGLALWILSVYRLLRLRAAPDIK
jgi:hypothetical protein